MNSSLLLWSTKRLRMSTRGLMVIRELGPDPLPCQFRRPFPPAPGRWVPTSVPTNTAATANSAPVRNSHVDPRSTWSPSQLVDRSRSATRWRTTKSMAVSAYSALGST